MHITIRQQFYGTQNVLIKIFIPTKVFLFHCMKNTLVNNFFISLETQTIWSLMVENLQIVAQHTRMSYQYYGYFRKYTKYFCANPCLLKWQISMYKGYTCKVKCHVCSLLFYQNCFHFSFQVSFFVIHQQFFIVNLDL